MKHHWERPYKLLSGSSLATLIVLSMIAAAVTAIGCSWPGTSHSVRFNGFQTEREMGRLPPLPTMAQGLNEARAYWSMEDTEEGDSFFDAMDKKSKAVDAIWDRAEAAEKDGNFKLELALLDDYLECTGGARAYWYEPTALQFRRNSAMDRIDALRALGHGSSATSVKAYLEARRIHDSDHPDAAEFERALEPAKKDAALKDNLLYLQATESYRQNNYSEAAKTFKALTQRYPRTEKREAALFMTAVATMKSSVTYVPATGNSDYDDSSVGHSADQAWHDAFAAFQKVIDEFPRGRYVDDARGWQAYLFLRRRDRASALVQYYRLLANPSEKARTEAAFSLTLVRSYATDDEMSRVEKELAGDPQAALAYAYHNIYNYSIDPGSATPPYEDVNDSSGNVDYEASRARNDQLEKQWSTGRASTTRRELKRTLQFSKRLMTSYPHLAIGSAFALRAAQASEELDDNGGAVAFSQLALKGKLNGDERSQALWVLGVAQHRSRRFEEARRSFQTLLRDYPQTRLAEDARRILAMIAEDMGDIDSALEQYIALDYDIDVSYFIDILMTPDQLAAFIASHPGSPEKNELTYALGIRYLRLNRWDDARKTFARVKTTPHSDFNGYCSTCNCSGDQRTDCSDPKQGVFDENDNLVITPSLVMRDIQTANDLESLEHAVDLAVGDEAQAEALYQYASYQYEARSRLFYNPLASPGYWNLSQLAAEGSYRAPNEPQILFEATQQHDVLARALAIYLDVVKRFPRTRAARDAFYTAAVCHERLSNYNPYWRQIYQNSLHAGERMVSYKDVKATYPDYQLPRGTFGWQPSTRTVNGGPGWQPPPQPPKRLTKRERVKRFLGEVENRATGFWNKTGKRWLTEMVILVALFFVMRVARENQRRLKTRLVRQRITESKEVVAYPWLELFWIDPEKPARREQIKKYLQQKQHEFIALARDRRSRPILLQSIVSHSAVTVLTLSLLWQIWYG